VVILFADDLGYADVGYQGGKVPTPAIDALAAQSARFSQGYVTASVCSPSRAGLMTGRYQNRFGHETNPASVHDAGTPLSEITLAELLRDRGYRTALIGKWHLGVLDQFHPMNQGFDEFFGFLHGAHTYFPEQARGQSLLRGREPVVEKEYLTDAFAREAVSFIERSTQTRNREPSAKNTARPFFLYLSFNAVHTPIEASDKYLERFPKLTGAAKTYAGMISAMDDAVGRVVGTLKQQGLDENTLLFFLNDNGGLLRYASNAPLRGCKATYFEGGIRVPLLVRWTGRLKPGEYPHPVISLDILPTAVAVAGGALPADRPYDGVNLLPFLSGANPSLPHETLFWRMRDMEAEVVRHGDWKYMNVRGSVSLFDLKTDPAETNDLATSKPQIVTDLAARFAAWDQQMPEPLWAFPAEERAERRTKRRNAGEDN
jgi:arylsulfatase A-like enzyme